MNLQISLFELIPFDELCVGSMSSIGFGEDTLRLKLNDCSHRSIGVDGVLHATKDVDLPKQSLLELIQRLCVVVGLESLLNLGAQLLEMAVNGFRHFFLQLG